MCEHCEHEAAEAGERLDQVIELYAKALKHPAAKDLSAAQHCALLAESFRDGYLLMQGHEALYDLCLGTAIAVHRLAALQEINGGAL